MKPRTISDELQDLILADIAKDGKPVNQETIKEYQTKISRALDSLVAEAENEYGKNEYGKKEYVSFADLKRENENV